MADYLTPVIERVKKYINNASAAVSPTVAPNELQGKAAMLREYNNAQAKPGLQPVTVVPVSEPINPEAKYGDRPGEKRIDTKDMLKPLGRYREGTDRVPETGPYILEEGEKVVPAEENPDNVPGAPVDFGGRVIANPKGVVPVEDTDSGVQNPRISGGANFSTELPTESPAMDTSNPPASQVVPGQLQEASAKEPHTLTGKSTLSGNTRMSPVETTGEGSMPVPQEPAKEKPVSAPDPFQIMKLQAAAKGDLVGLGSAIIAERIANPDIEMPVYGGPVAKGTSKPSPGAMLSKEAEKKDESLFVQEDYQNNLKALKEGITKALSSGDLEKAGQLERTLVELQRSNPFGSPANHPGILGKIAHGLGVAGNIAGDAFIPNVVPNIPGSRANLEQREQQASQDMLTGAEEKKTQSEIEKNKAVASNSASELKLRGQLLTKGYLLSTDPRTGDTILIDVPGFRDAPKDTQAGYAGAVQNAIESGKDPSTDPKVKQWADALAATQKTGQAENKAAFQETVKKVASKYSTDPKALDASLDKARKDKTISDEEYTAAKAYQAANPNAATTLTVRNEAGEEANRRAVEKLFVGKHVTVPTPEGGTALYTYDQARDKGYAPEQMSILQPGQVEKTKTEVANAIDTKHAVVEYYDDFMKYGPKLPAGDKEILAALQRNEAKTSGELGGLVGDIPVLGPISEATNRRIHGWMMENGYDNLSAGGKKLMADYFNTIIANFADMKRRLGGIGRNDSMILAEMHTIPMGNIDPSSAREVFLQKIKSLDDRNQYLPRVDGKHPSDIKPKPLHPVGSIIRQGNKDYKVTKLDQFDGVAEAEEVK